MSLDINRDIHQVPVLRKKLLNGTVNLLLGKKQTSYSSKQDTELKFLVDICQSKA